MSASDENALTNELVNFVLLESHMARGPDSLAATAFYRLSAAEMV
jgi:hypothetical protein